MMYMNRIHKASALRSRSRWLTFIAMGLAIVFAAHAVAQAPAAQEGAAPPMSAEELGKLVGPIALYPDDLVAIILPASTNPLQLVQADRFLDKRKADPKLPVDDKWDDSGEVAAQLSRRREDDEWRPRLDDGARRGGRRRPGRGDRGGAGVPPQGAGRGQPQVGRQAGGEGREGDRHTSSRRIRR